MNRLAGIAIGILAGAAAAWAQADSDMTARQIFDFGVKAPATVKPPVPKSPGSKPPVAPGVKDGDGTRVHSADGTGVQPSGSQSHTDGSSVQPVAYVPLALRYSILQRRGNAFEEVDADSEFHSGDRIRVRVESNGPAYLYIVLIGSSGQSRVLFPDKEIDGGNNRILAGRPYMVPSEKDPPFYFDQTAGVERVSLVLSRSPEPDLEKLIYAAGDPTRIGDQPKTMIAQSIDGSALGGVREKVLARDLVFEKYDGPAADGKQEKAVYAASKDKSADARLFVDLKLTHK